MSIEKVKLICGIIFSGDIEIEKVEADLQDRLSMIDYRSAVLDFIYTDYYHSEMGKPLFRKFLSFNDLIDPGMIAKIKLMTGRIEGKYRIGGARRVNIDPGYIAPSKLVLASTKDFFHRIYLSDGIYAEVTLRWRNSAFEYFEWTFPDYRTEEYRAMLTRIRELYMGQIRR